MNLNLNRLPPKTKAALVVVLFVTLGTIGWYTAGESLPDTIILVPLIIFYLSLTVNSYFSIKLFSSITPMDNRAQILVDVFLFASYVILAFNFGNPQMFLVSALFLFIFAPIKYILLLGKIPHPRLLKKKIIIDLFGTLLCASSLLVSLMGLETYAAWLLAGLFFPINLYFLFINPMYRLVD